MNDAAGLPSTTGLPSTGLPSGTGLPFAKGHGTENDFVLVPDHDGALALGPAAVQRICSRRSGLGADGVIRVVRSRALPDGAAALVEDPAAEWFMDYRNADGSTSQMCGNGVRVLVASLLHEGLVDPAALDAPPGLAVGTRAGVKRVRRAVGPDGQPWLATDMGPWRLLAPGAAAARGADAAVAVPGLDGVPRPGLSLDLGNPHTVVALAGLDELAAADLAAPPAVDPLPPHGSNVELVVPLDADEGPHGEPTGRLAMRVHERGVGETRSCGTGACAAALAARAWGGPGAPDRWLVQVPGGLLAVRALPHGRVELAGPAVLVAAGTIDPGWLGGDTPQPARHAGA
ncbi:diaminopimelate epimerase [Quadrisphaera sp. DSM 44207]|uniref:diaminopimelate epimerase n=1 Tax=Quadrisphaera sp. DSM 44207 TaxID=1881057 RepID=UPI0008871F86|nr:diaminopimelate epimerase [Quadrisphaera sp. DSM 44207]SDQ34122.1 diaminopimelate epimerase [Quadrisphaera sp. DSM 44207]